MHHKHAPRAPIKIAGEMVSDRNLGPAGCSFLLIRKLNPAAWSPGIFETVAASLLAENLLPQLTDLLQTPLDRAGIDVQLVGDFLVREAFDLEGGDSLSGLVGQ